MMQASNRHWPEYLSTMNHVQRHQTPTKHSGMADGMCGTRSCDYSKPATSAAQLVVTAHGLVSWYVQCIQRAKGRGREIYVILFLLFYTHGHTQKQTDTHTTSASTYFIYIYIYILLRWCRVGNRWIWKRFGSILFDFSQKHGRQSYPDQSLPQQTLTTTSCSM